MRVEPNLMYRTRGGMIVGPLKYNAHNGGGWPWELPGAPIHLCWDHEGCYRDADSPHDLDLVSVYSDEPAEAHSQPAVDESEPPAPAEAHSQPPNESGNALIAQAVRETAVSLQRFADLLLALADHAAQDPARPSVDTTGTAQQVKAETAAAQEATEWVDWYGGLCPLATGTLVEVRYRDGSTHTGMINDARRYDFEFGLRQAYWFHDRLPNDIIAYRIIKEPKHR